MPGVDRIPGVSQVKTAAQLLTGDLEGAARTQKNFVCENMTMVIKGLNDGAVMIRKQIISYSEVKK